ncbi:DUF6055 domain-containing protein [Clostridium sp. HBUAS56017]|uniref:DUF6055 domain-containing protein n=1 Tax=Clostridium sp. HBUAS56017 TaxID=2571128 RepID=UPI0011789B22|nr:DUF6055 domain-containing protein [Clostridium sp. HBUAS56017]
MILKKVCKTLGIIILSTIILSSMANTNAAVSKINSLQKNTVVSSTYIARDSFYDLNEKSVNRLSSEHFQIIWGSNDETGTVNEDLVRGNLQNLETIRDFYVNVMGLDDTSVSVNSPINSSSIHYKTNLYINKTGLSKITDDWAYMSSDGDGFAYLAVEPGAMRVDEPSWVIPHEYAHAITMHQRGTIAAPWYETLANWFRDQYLGSTYYRYGDRVYGPTSDFFQPVVLNSDYYFPHMKNYYDAWPFLLYVTENPDNMNGLGMDVMRKMLHDGSNEIMFDKIQRLSGTSTKDMLGGYARRMVTMDFRRQSSYTNYLNDLLKDSSNYDKVYTTLENTNDGWLKVTDSRAPQQGGYNIIPLNIDMSSKQVSVNFQGDKSVSGADFRASIVTKTRDGKTRYSTMWNNGINTLNLQGDEEKAYLVVCATPDEMLDLTSFDVNAVGTKYPYKVQVSTSGKSDEKVNIASKAVVSTSYCSEWENISALNDSFDPINSNDRSHAVYGNWPETGTQWVQYKFDKKYTISQSDVYWFKDNGGIDVPKSYKIQYWNGNKWVDVKNAVGYGTAINQYNTTTFTPVTTNSIRIQVVSNGSASTGILEWKVE